MGARALAYQIRGEGTEVLELDIYDVVGESWWGDSVSAKAVRRALKNAKNATTIKLRVNSAGGDVFDGFAIYNLLRDHPARVEADVDALAASIASVIVMAADEIRMASSAMMMIHNPWAGAVGEASELRSVADVLDKIQGQATDIYAARSGLSRERVLELMNAETWMTADEARELGFADQVIAAKARPDAKAFAALNLSGLERAPAAFAMAVDDARAAMGRARAEKTTRTGLGAPEGEMNEELRKRLAARLGLHESASIDEIMRAAMGQLDTLVPRADLEMHLRRAASAERPRAALAQRFGLASDAGIDVVLAAAQTHIEKSEKDAHAAAAKRAIEAACKAGKIAPASVPHYERMCATVEGLASFEALAATLPTLVADDTRTDDDPPGAKGTLTAQQKRLAKEMGLTEEEFLKARESAED